MPTKVEVPEVATVTMEAEPEVKKAKKTAEKTAAEVKEAVAEVTPDKAETVSKKAAATAKKTTKKVVTESKEAQEEVVAGVKKYTKLVTEPAHQVYLVGLGAVALAQDEIVELYHKLMDEGEAFNKDSLKMLRRAEKVSKDEVADVQELVEDKLSAAGETVETTVEKVLARLNVPTKADIDRLSKKISELAEKVDELKSTNGHKA